MASPSHFSEFDLASLCHIPAPNAKAMRRIHAGVQAQAASPSKLLAERSRHLAELAWRAKAACLAKLDSQAAQALGLSNPALGHRELSEMARCAPSSPLVAALEGRAGRLAPAADPAALRESFLLRRSAHGWARRIRAEFGGPLFSDPLLLSMLRRVHPAEAQECLAGLLLHSALALDLRSAACAMSLGADPLARPSPLFAHSHWRTGMNALGAAISSRPEAPFDKGSRPIAPNSRESDQLASGACLVLAACCRPEDLPRLLSAGTRAARVLPRLDAMEMSASFGMIHCARLFSKMGMRMGRIGPPFPWDDPQEPPARAHAFRELACQEQKAELAMAAPSPQGPSPAAARLRI